jgi:DNA repair protein RecO (recombination protein O)
MSETIIQCQPAFVLRQQNYRETSLIIDLFTQDYGRLSILAKGVRKAKSKDFVLLQPFLLLNVSFLGRTELKTMSGVEATGQRSEITGMALYCGYYLNELLYRFLPKFDPHPEVFNDYKECLTKLCQGTELDASLRIFELNLMEKIGYGIQLDYDSKNKLAVDGAKKYIFDREQGITEYSEGLISGQTLLAMQQRKYSDPIVRKEAKQLMRMVIDSHLNGQVFKSRIVLNNLIKRL